MRSYDCVSLSSSCGVNHKSNSSYDYTRTFSRLFSYTRVFICQLHLSKGLKIPAPSAVDETKGFQTVIYRFIFPSTYATIANPRIGFGSAPRSPAQVHTHKSSNPSRLDAILDRQSNSGPRALRTREQFASSHFHSSAPHRIKPQRKVHKPSAQLNHLLLSQIRK